MQFSKLAIYKTTRVTFKTPATQATCQNNPIGISGWDLDVGIFLEAPQVIVVRSHTWELLS